VADRCLPCGPAHVAVRTRRVVSLLHPVLYSAYAEADAAKRSAEARARDEIRRARLNLESARSNRVKAEEQERLARENAQLVKVSFDAGTATYLEVADAATALRSAELGRVAETLNARLAVLQLAKAVGAFDPR